MTPKTEVSAPVFESAKPSVSQVLRGLVQDPYHSLIVRWNWKSAIFSSLIRANIFFFVTLRSGWRAALGAFGAELAYRVVTSGYYGALTQSFRAAEPAWAAGITVMILLPISQHSVEFLVHYLRHTPHLAANIITSMCFTAVSTLFNWYAMRKGSLIVGKESQSVARDMASMPRLIGGFLAAGPVALWSILRPLLWPENFVADAWVARTLNESEDAASD